MLRFVVRAAAFAAFFGASAQAGEEQKCAAQFKLEEHLILEWAALGGDPSAQYSIAQCASPTNAPDMTSAEKTYALKWLMLAACEADGGQKSSDRDRATRRLKYGSNLSFRRFGGVTEDETWTAREKSLIAIRRAQAADLAGRLDRLKGVTSEGEQDAARRELGEELARMGPLGLIRLADLTSCSAYGASATFAAAALGAAAEAWSASSKSSLYGPSAHPEWNLQNAAAESARELSKTERRAMAVEKDALLRSDPIRLAKLEDEAALGRLQELGFAAAGADGLVFSGRATTTAVQYALESLGFIEFVNGPDNDYGPSTIEAAKRAQAAYGKPQTRWLAPEEVRELVCDAAVKKSDPVSYYHLTMMYAEGMGFRKDLARAKTSIARAEEILIARLESKESLPAWKAREYPAFLTRIQTLKSAIDDAYAALPAHAAAAGDASSRVCE